MSYGSFSKESTIIWSDLVNATKRLTPGASSIPAQFSYFSFYYFEINFYFYKSIISIHCILSFASYHSSSKGSCFKLFKILFLVFSSIFLENTMCFYFLFINCRHCLFISYIAVEKSYHFAPPQPPSLSFSSSSHYTYI